MPYHYRSENQISHGLRARRLQAARFAIRAARRSFHVGDEVQGVEFLSLAERMRHDAKVLFWTMKTFGPTEGTGT